MMGEITRAQEHISNNTAGDKQVEIIIRYPNQLRREIYKIGVLGEEKKNRGKREGCC